MEEGLQMIIRALAQQAVKNYRKQPFELINIFKLLNASMQSALFQKAHEILNTRKTS